MRRRLRRDTGVSLSAERAVFLYLPHRSELPKGNLSSHLAKLEQTGYVEIVKGYDGEVPQTTLRLTEAGRTAYRPYREQMKRAVDRLPR